MKLLRKNSDTGLAEEITGAGVYIPQDETPDYTTGWIAYAGTNMVVTVTHNLNTPYDELDCKITYRSGTNVLGNGYNTAAPPHNFEKWSSVNNNSIRTELQPVVSDTGDKSNATPTHIKIDIYKRKERLKVIETLNKFVDSPLKQSGTVSIPSATYNNGNPAARTVTFPTHFDAPPIVNISQVGETNLVGGFTVHIRNITATGFSVIYDNMYGSPLTLDLSFNWTAVGSAHYNSVTVDDTAIYNGQEYSRFKPETWITNVELDFGDNVYGKRVEGTHTLVANVNKPIPIATGATDIIGSGGRWFNGGNMMEYGHSNAGATKSAVTVIEAGVLNANVISNTAYTNAAYNVWVLYRK